MLSLGAGHLCRPASGGTRSLPSGSAEPGRLDNEYNKLYCMDMKRVSTTKLRANLSGYIKEVNETGECLLITEYNLPAALLCPRPEIEEHVTTPTGGASRTRA